LFASVTVIAGSSSQQTFAPLTEMKASSVQAPPFHAVAALDVHHNNDDCKTGNFIERWNRVAGDAGLPLCKECAALSAHAAPHAETTQEHGS
jgi:hypothetical protein